MPRYPHIKMKVAKLLDGKKTAQDIADILNIRRHVVYRCVHQLDRRRDLKYAYAGCIPDDLRHTVALRSEVDNWIRAQVPQDATPADVIAAIIEDAFLEETQGAA